MTSMPRQAKSMASVSPTGPPPTISTLVLIPPISRDGVCQLSLAWSGQTEKVPMPTAEWEELARLGQLGDKSSRTIHESGRRHGGDYLKAIICRLAPRAQRLR